MEKLSKWLSEFAESIIVGSIVLLALIAIAVSVQHFFTLLSIAVFVGLGIYLLWRIK